VTQLSFFAAAASEPAVDDLAGLLAGPGQAVVRDGRARVSVVVADDWRVEGLRLGLAGLGLAAEVVGTQAGGTSVRTPFTADLLPLVRRWHAGGRKRPPAGLVLDGPGLRWWCLAAGRADRADGAGYLLGLGSSDVDEESARAPLARALAAAGLPAAHVGPRGGGPAYRVSGLRRLSRLRELVGEPPPGSEPGGWPG
jgi:hypothetical protein